MHRFALGGYRKQREDVANYIKKGSIFANIKGKVVKLVTFSLEGLAWILGNYFRGMQ